MESVDSGQFSAPRYNKYLDDSVATSGRSRFSPYKLRSQPVKLVQPSCSSEWPVYKDTCISPHEACVILLGCKEVGEESISYTVPQFTSRTCTFIVKTNIVSGNMAIVDDGWNAWGKCTKRTFHYTVNDNGAAIRTEYPVESGVTVIARRYEHKGTAGAESRFTRTVYTTESTVQEALVIVVYTWSGNPMLSLLGIDDGNQHITNEAMHFTSHLEGMSLPELKTAVLNEKLRLQLRFSQVIERAESVLNIFSRMPDQDLIVTFQEGL